MRTNRKSGLVAVIALVLSLTGLGRSSAELPVTVPGTSSAEAGAAALVDVTVTDTGLADEVTFTFAGDTLPTVEATSATPPFYDIPGEVVTVAGTSFVQVRMFAARGVSFGESCQADLAPAPTPGPGETVVEAFFSCVDGLNGPAPVVPSHRVVPAGTDEQVLTATLEELLAGPTAADTAAGLTSWFSAATADDLVSVSLAPDGTATVDFDPTLATTIPNASTSAGSDQLLRGLDATVFQFPGVTAATYTLGGSCADFFGWIQMDCTTRTPDDGGAALYAVTYVGPDRVAGASQNVTEAVQLEDFEAQLVWMVGLRAATDVTVSTATSPARVIVRVPHPAPPVASQPRFTG